MDSSPSASQPSAATLWERAKYQLEINLKKKKKSIMPDPLRIKPSPVGILLLGVHMKGSKARTGAVQTLHCPQQLGRETLPAEGGLSRGGPAGAPGPLLTREAVELC